MAVIEVIQLLLFTVGVLSFGSLTAVWWREWRVGTGSVTLGYGLMTTLSLFWFLVHLSSFVSTFLFPLWTESIRVLIWILAYFFPPLILQLCLDEAERSHPLTSPLWRWGARLGILVAAISGVPPLLYWLGVDSRGWLSVSSIALILLFGATAFFAVAIGWVTRQGIESPRRQRARRWEVMLWGLVLVVLVFGLMPKASNGQVFWLISPAFPLLFVFASTYHFERFLFFDLFVKRGTFSCLVLLLLAAHFSILPAFSEDLDAARIRPWLYSLSLLPLTLLLPWLYRRFETWVDQAWLGRRFRPFDAVKHFLAGIQSATNETLLVQNAERLVSEIFQAPTRIHLSEPPPARESDVLVPFQIGPDLFGCIELGRRANDQPFYGTDLALIDSLMEVFSRVLGNVRLEERRRVQEQREKQLQLHASQSELKALRAQINPHFLFNALNAIAGLIDHAPERAEETVEQLAEVFRYTLRGSQQEWAVLKDELEFARAYMEVEKARFGERLQVKFQTDPELSLLRVPTMMVQTLVENAVKHGVSGVQGVGRISVSCHCSADSVRIEVRDNGPGPEGRPTPRQAPGGFGLQNIRERLEGYFGSQAWLKVVRDPVREQTIATICLPRRAGRQETRTGT